MKEIKSMLFMIGIFFSIAFFSKSEEKYKECIMENRHELLLKISKIENYGKALKLKTLSKCINDEREYFYYIGGGVFHINILKDSDNIVTYNIVEAIKNKNKKVGVPTSLFYILIEKNDEIKDVVKKRERRTFSVDVEFNNEYKYGMLIGIWNERTFYLKIEELYRITDEGKLIRLDLKEIDKISRFPVLDYFRSIEDDGSVSIDDFRFGVEDK